MANAQPEQVRRYLGLSFSGGGYRAASFSVGTLALLEDLELNEKTLVLSGVSGGSIALGAYLCAKAGAEARIDKGMLDREDWFYKAYFHPFLESLSQEKMARSFVNLSWLLQPRKLIKGAADANDRLFKKLLEEPATLGSPRLQSLLNHEHLAPDYAFFNASNISSLNLFRFGVQKHQSKETTVDGSGCNPQDTSENDVILGQWIFSCQPQTNLTSSLLQFSQSIRLADCVAASHAFPFGLEPMVFPHDFFSPKKGSGMQAIKAFSESEVCNGQRSVALLDGGLYDNLGLASVEDIRHYDLRIKAKSNQKQKKDQTHQHGAENKQPWQRPAFVVIATDVDNIQPSLSFYEAIKAPTNPEALTATPTRRGLVKTIKGLVIKTVVVALFVPAIPLALAAKVCGLKSLDSFVPNILRKLGFSEPFIQDKSHKDLKTFRLILSLWRLVCNKEASKHRFSLFENLTNALVQQRLRQLTPIVCGYLKRTRSLTYGYLQTNYEQQRREARDQAPHLVRNMIFELTQGADADPDYAARLITLPVRHFGSLNDQEEEVYQETSAMRKLRHALVAANLILEEQHDGNGDIDNESTTFHHEDTANTAVDPAEGCLRAIWQKGIEQLPAGSGQGDADLQTLIKDLRLVDAARIWTTLWERLIVMEEGGSPNNDKDHKSLMSSDMLTLVESVCKCLQSALHEGEINICQVLENCRTSPEPVSIRNSWIPLICEMATNLPTTLWIKEYTHYIPNHVVNGQVVSLGRWFTSKPEPNQIPVQLRNQPILKLNYHANICASAAITTLAGYLTTAFNLLEYYYAYLEQSDSLVHGLSRTLTELKLFNGQEGCATRRRILDLPYALRQASERCIHSHWHQLQRQSMGISESPALTAYDEILLNNLRALNNPESRLKLLRPWLNSRGPLPESWLNDPQPDES